MSPSRERLWIRPAALAIVIRVTLFAAGAPHPARFLIDEDSRGYVVLARNMVLGRGFSQAERAPYHPDVRRTPVYPSVLAAVFAVSPGAVRTAALVNVAASTAAVVATVMLAGRLFGAAAGSIAGLLLALDLTSAAYATQLLTEPLFTLLICLAVLSATDLVLSERTSGVVAGTLTGLAALCRPIGLFLAAALVPAFVWRRSRTRARVAQLTMIAATLSAVPIGLWTIRNQRAAGVATFTSQAATNAYFHRAAYVVAELEHRRVEDVREEWEREFSAAAAGWSEAQRVEWMNAHGLSVIWAHPFTYAIVFTKGLGRMARPDSDVLPPLLGVTRGTTPWRVLMTAAWIQVIVIYGLAVVGAWTGFRRWRVAAFVPLGVLAYFVVLGGPEMYARFRVPIMPVVCMLAGVGARPDHGNRAE